MKTVISKILDKKILSSLIIAMIIGAVMSALALTKTLNEWHLKAADSLYTYENPSKEIVIIAIDEISNQPPPTGLGRYAQWTRENFSKLLQKLEFEDPKVVAFDVIFNNYTQMLPMQVIGDLKLSAAEQSNKEKLKTYEELLGKFSNPLKNPIDTQLAEQMGKTKNLILAMSANENLEIKPINKFAKNATIANVQAEFDSDGILRRTSIFSPAKNIIGAETQTAPHTATASQYDNFALAVAKKYLDQPQLEIPEKFLSKGKESTITDNTKNTMLINYFADPFKYKMIPFVKVLNGEFPPGTFKDKIVLIGVTSFKELQDDILTPRSKTTPMPGVEAWANQIQTIIDNKFIAEQSPLSQAITLILLAAALTIAFNYLGIALSILLAILTAVGYIIAAHLFFRQGLVLNMLYPFFVIVLSFIGSWLYKYFVADRKKREIKSAFAHYLNHELVDQISQNPELLKLGGEKRVVTVFFSDIKDSTTLSEQTDSAAWVAQINEYFTTMERILKSTGGTLDKYEGDAIMGFWNAPIAQADHAARAYNCAITMQRALLDLNHQWQLEGKPQLQIRIGINTGEAIVGNFGSQDRFDYTVMGDTVNVASRLESIANKFYGTGIITSGNPETDFAKFLFRELDIVYLPGKNKALKIYELICPITEATAELQNKVAAYHNGLDAYRRSDWATAINFFSSIQNDPAAAIMQARCSALRDGQKIAGLEENMVFRIAK